jgi:class 3 adenylate cyclase/tetratricopeptide (TPR) repeat protein
VRTCRACGNDNPEGSRFCNGCGTGLGAGTDPVTDERKVVSVLFCDLVGSTAWAERMDPEDVRAVVRPYYELLRRDIEAFGGTVEKFIGDAVMAVFGAPRSHEDDPERAVRAGLRILEAIEELNQERGTNLAVRVGINTGEVVVALGARPELGEGIVTGDVVNTAARLQGGAPVGAIAVGRTTYRSTIDVVDYESLEALTVKGKTEPVAAWRALRARAPTGADLTRRHDVALVGRDAERARLSGLVDQTLRDRSCQLVTIMGEPGVGKSRMIQGLFQFVDARSEVVAWRQGRCLPYGDGITFWALGEIVKAQAEILESDPPRVTKAKLDRTLEGLSFEPTELAWVGARLAPLVGVESTSSGGREESFTAWRRFVEALAGPGGAVLVFEDLHWADPALLAFVEYLADSIHDVPLLLVCSARPEFLDAHPGWADELGNATSLSLSPLSAPETASLVGALLGSSRLPADVQEAIVERAGGNPLYAEQLIRMLRDRGLLIERGQTWELAEGAQILFPEGIHGIISARLDALPRDHKSLLQDASVVGRVFWSGALEAMNGWGRRAMRDLLAELTAKEFLREVPMTSMEGEREYSFWHMLVRDAAYAQIPRAARAEKHDAVSHWLEDRAGERIGDVADVLAYHASEALTLRRAAGADAAGMAHRARRFLMLAGDRARGLDAERALAMYEQALALAPPGDPIRGEILRAIGSAEWSRGHFERARALLEEAIPTLLAAGQPIRAADAKMILAVVMTTIAPGEVDWRLLSEATAELERLPAGKEIVRAYALWANWQSATGRYVEAIEWAERSLSLAKELDLPIEPFAPIQRGGARCWTGDLGGIEDIHLGIDLAVEQGSINVAVMGRNQLAEVLKGSTGPEEALAELESGAALARRGGMLMMEELIGSGSRSEILYQLGRWDEMVETTSAYLAEERGDSNTQVRLICQTLLCEVSTWRGDLVRASELGPILHEAATEFDGPWPVVELCVVAHLALVAGDVDRSARALRALEAYPRMREDWSNVPFLPEMTRVALHAIGIDFAQQLVTGVPESPMALRRIALEMVDAQLAEARGELVRAVELYRSAEQGWRTFSVPERAQSLLGGGRCLLAMGEPGATDALRGAREVFGDLGAELYLPDVDPLLEEAVARSL